MEGGAIGRVNFHFDEKKLLESIQEISENVITNTDEEDPSNAEVAHYLLKELLAPAAVLHEDQPPVNDKNKQSQPVTVVDEEEQKEQMINVFTEEQAEEEKQESELNKKLVPLGEGDTAERSLFITQAHSEIKRSTLVQ